ncbi:MAG TPA: branched-chain amino acid ABC transporter permease [Hyphomicrobiaceae bacterium]|jgi:branched-chain amino acid transport system permease protein|nr:branched-chain amino acid ABC transporter permease [Hyphomicrobiaceae bacterium]
MSLLSRRALPYWLILAAGTLAPFAFPDYSNELAILWLMIVFASTWDILGGQMGYNSLGNIFFFGAGMYICAVVQIGLFYDVGMYTSGARTTHIDFSTAQYITGFALGIVAAGFGAAVLAIAAGWIVFGLRGPYFAIGTLGLAVAAAELTAAWDWVGAASGVAMPVFPGAPQTQKLFFYFSLFALGLSLLVFLNWLYSTNFGLSLNAIRDDEEKAEAMGLHTRRYKRTAWAISAFFLGIAGALFGNMTGFIEPRDIAFPTTTFNLFMVVMALLGGKGTLWGPVIGAVIFHTFKEVTWTYFLGWQFVALGLLIVVTIVYFQQGVVGFLMERFPHWFQPRVVTESPKRAGALAPQPEGAE